MRTRLALAALVAFAHLAVAPSTRAADVGVAGTVLDLSESGAGGRPRVEFVVRGDRGITKGPGVADPRRDPAGLSGTFEVFYSDAPGTFLVRWDLAAPWDANRNDVARFVNDDAPDGPTTVRRLQLRNGRKLRLLARGLGDGTTADLGAGAPSAAGGITAVLTIHNAVDGSTHRLCTRFAEADGSEVALLQGKRGRRLRARGGVPAPCPPEITLTSPERCEILNDAECLLPYPSSRFLVPAPTATGLRLDLPAEGLPQVIGEPVPVDPLNRLDGFSPAVQILMHFPQGVDPALTAASRLLAPNCCGQPAGPPWIDTRTHTGRSLDADSPSVLLDADTGERVLHWIEPDARAAGNPARQLVFLRPARILEPGHRYIVAMRGLVAPGGGAVVAEPAFAALRDGVFTTVPAIEARRAYLNERVFDVLTANGIARAELVLAFDFTVRSQGQLTADMLSMRDQAYARVAETEALPPSSATGGFVVTNVIQRDCAQPGQIVWRDVTGRFESPLFLTAEPTATNTPFLNRDAAGTPVPAGVTMPTFTVSIPCSVFDPAVVSRPVLLGHGLGQTGDFMTGVIPSVVGGVVPWNSIAAATDWRGLSGQDLGWVATHIIGVGQSQLHRFEALPARLRQGMVNTLVLARLMKRGLFNRHPAFQRPDGSGVFPGPSEDLAYYGISLGGIMGTYLAGLTPDIPRLGLDVPSVNFSCLLQRATPFAAFDGLLAGIGVSDPIKAALGIQLTHEMWVEGEPASVVHHITTDPLPGAGAAKRILYTPAWLDKQVSNQCTEIAARTMGLPSLIGSIQQGLEDMPDLPGPLSSAYVTWDLGELDILNPAHAPFIPPLANLIPSGVCDPHPRRPTIPAAIRQLTAFLQPGGMVENFCTGLCDGVSADEKPGGGSGTCVP